MRVVVFCLIRFAFFDQCVMMARYFEVKLIYQMQGYVGNLGLDEAKSSELAFIFRLR